MTRYPPAYFYQSERYPSEVFADFVSRPVVAAALSPILLPAAVVYALLFMIYFTQPPIFSRNFFLRGLPGFERFDEIILNPKYNPLLYPALFIGVLMSMAKFIVLLVPKIIAALISEGFRVALKEDVEFIVTMPREAVRLLIETVNWPLNVLIFPAIEALPPAVFSSLRKQPRSTLNESDVFSVPSHHFPESQVMGQASYREPPYLGYRHTAAFPNDDQLPIRPEGQARLGFF